MKIVQLYEVARTAHFERMDESRDVTLLFREKRYDFDQSLAARARAQQAGMLKSMLYAASHRVDIIEVNEPLVVRATIRSLVFTSAARLRARLLGLPRPRVVSYAIGNVSSATLRRHLPWKARVKFELQRPWSGLLWRQVDFIAYGTSDAQELYRAEFSAATAPKEILVEAVSAAEAVNDQDQDVRAPALIFLGDLSDRKGFPDVLNAWASVRTRVPDSTFTIIGRGAGSSDAEQLSESDDRVTVYLDPERARIFEELDQAKVLVLPSRRRPLWREQVGLPIVEGLSHGCRIVTTSETGIASWLAAHDHFVVDEDNLISDLPEALVAALEADVTPAEIKAPLPDQDGRLTARDRLYEAAAGPAAPRPRRNLFARVYARRKQVIPYMRGVLRGHPGVRIGRGVHLTGPGKYDLDRSVNLTDGVRIWVGPDAVFTMKKGSKIGDRTIVNVETSVTLAEGTRVSWDVQIMDTDFHWIEGEDGTQKDHTAAIHLGPNALIGARSMVLKGVSVGDGAVVGAGSVVRRSVPAGTIAAGNPAREVGRVRAWGSAAK